MKTFIRYDFNRKVKHNITEEKFVIIWTQFSLTDELAEEEGLSGHYNRQIYRHSITFYGII